MVLQRGPEELLSPLSNGTAMSPQPVALDGDAKKAKLDNAAPAPAPAQQPNSALAAAAAAAAVSGPHPTLLHLSQLQQNPGVSPTFLPSQ